MFFHIKLNQKMDIFIKIAQIAQVFSSCPLQLERCESQVIDMLVKVQYIINVIRAQY